MATAANDTPRAIEAYRRVLRDHPLSSEAAEAEKLLESLGGFVLDTPAAASAEFGRAEALFKARRWDQARTAFARVRDLLQGDERDQSDFRLAQIDATNGQHRIAREIFRRFTSHPQLAADAQYAIVSSTRMLGEEIEFKQLTDDFVARNPTHRLAEEALNELARHYVLADEDGEAAKIYARMINQFPTGVFAERATWKAGWWAYREKNFRETIRVFEKGAATFPRSDYRPSWLYWTARVVRPGGGSSGRNRALPADCDGLPQFILRSAGLDPTRTEARGERHTRHSTCHGDAADAASHGADHRTSHRIRTVSPSTQ